MILSLKINYKVFTYESNQSHALFKINGKINNLYQLKLLFLV